MIQVVSGMQTGLQDRTEVEEWDLRRDTASEEKKEDVVLFFPSRPFSVGGKK